MTPIFYRRTACALSLALAAAGALGANPDQDARGGSDNPLITRYAGSILYTYGDEDVGVAKTFVSKNDKPVQQDVEGKLSNRLYFGPAGRGPLDVFRNYQAALRAAGFDTLYQCEAAQCERDGTQAKMVRWVSAARWIGSDKTDYYVVRMFEYKPGFHYLHARKTGANGPVDVQVALRAGDTGDKKTEGRTLQFVQVIEAAGVSQDQVTVDAAAIGSALKRDGRIALYGVLFDTNEARIKPDSAATLAQMAKTLKDDPALKVFIVGHTDNVGAVETNLTLSRRRAEAVVEALVKTYGIAPARLQAHGVANLAPTVANSDDNGRSRNRRVEMVVR
jgi:outer membrane protein OmpA-like peptidoglycan-associated protein